MRILIHGINFSPELTGIGKYTGEIAEWLALRGHEVRVVTAPPYYPQWRVAEGFVNGWNTSELISKQRFQPNPPPLGEGVKEGRAVNVYRCPLWVPAKPSGLKRVLHLASFALSSFPVMLRQIFWRPDVVLVVEPPLFCAPQAWLVARLSGGKAWLHIQDYEMDAAFELGLLKGIMLRGLVAACERWMMRRFDRISTISQRMFDRAVTKGIAPKHVVLFPNWVDLSSIQNGVSKLNRYREELTISPDAVVALYSGNMGGKQGLEILAQVARLLRNVPNLIFIFCGNGTGRDDLIALCNGLPNVQIIDLQPIERLGELLTMADIHLLPQRADAADLVMPSKLTGMLASGRPVVATAHPDTELAKVVSACGLVVKPEQPQAFADAIRVLAQDVELRIRLGLAGRVYAEENLNRDVVLGRFETELKNLVKAED